MGTKHAPPTSELLRAVDAAFAKTGQHTTDDEIDLANAGVDPDRHLEPDRPRKRPALKTWAKKKKP